jgi:hypothetical protein
MAIFAVIAPAANENLETAVKAQFPDNYYPIAPGQFFVSGERLTTSKVHQLLGVSGGGVGRVLILPVRNYTGWHAKDMWEWLEAQTNPTPRTSEEPPSETDDD